MANPTTNYGFVLPTPTDLVTDLPADFDVALQGVDTRLKALQPGTTSGDLAYSSATANTNVRLGIGSNGQVLAVSAGVPAWTTTADVTPLTTKGDVFTFSTVDARIGVGANNTVLTADSAEATGLKWATPATGSLTKIATATFTTVASTGTSFDNTISSTYDDYLITFDRLKTSVDADIKFNTRYAGPTTETAASNTGMSYIKNSSGTDGSWYMNNEAFVKIATTNSTHLNDGNMILSGMNSGVASRYRMTWNITLANYNGGGFGSNFLNNNATARIYTGFILTPSTGTLTGTATIYGIEK